ncbi:MAG: cell division protein FtsQ/DivIB [Xanthomonadaceae bacterium]|nr:cell division protein FtsQ/DivIB [Xanthomonadaceae bacterium]
MRKLTGWLLVSFACLAMGLAVAIAGRWHDAERWPIRWLEVEGELHRITSAQVRSVVAEQARRGFFVIDIDRARRRVEDLPWVAAASVSRHWPDALKITILEHRAVVRWNDETLIGATGEAFRVAGTDGMQGLAHLSGPDSRRAEVFQRWKKIRARLVDRALEIDALALDARGAWRLELGNGHQLLLGREHLDERLERYLSVYGGLAEITRIKRVDLRYPNGLAVIRHSATEVVESTASTPDASGRRGMPVHQSNPGAQPHHG